MNNLQNYPPYIRHRLVVHPLSASTPVSTLTPLLAFEDLGKYYGSILLVVINLSLTDQVHMVVDTSEDGVHLDNDKQQDVVALPGCQASSEIGPHLVRRYFALSAYTDGPGYPTANVQWGIFGLQR